MTRLLVTVNAFCMGKQYDFVILPRQTRRRMDGLDCESKRVVVQLLVK